MSKQHSLSSSSRDEIRLTLQRESNIWTGKDVLGQDFQDLRISIYIKALSIGSTNCGFIVSLIDLPALLYALIPVFLRQAAEHDQAEFLNTVISLINNDKE